MAFAIRVSMAARAPQVLAAAAILLWSGSSHPAFAACVVPSDTAVISVQRIPAPESGSERLLQLGDRIAIKVKNLGDLLKDPNCTSKPALFLDGQARRRGSTPSSRPTTATCSSSTSARRRIRRRSGSTSLPTPSRKDGSVRLPSTSAGRTRAPFRESRRFRGSTCSRRVGRSFSSSCCWPCSRSLRARDQFGAAARFSPASRYRQGHGRSAGLDAAAAGGGPIRLARTQAAWWLFIILAAYILIGLVTGNFATSINSTALTLLGIGAATAVGGVVISQSKKEDQQARARTLLTRITDLQELGILKAVASPARPSFRRAVTPSCRKPTLRRLAPRPPGSMLIFVATPSTTPSPRTRDREASCSTS